jgi:hypothetical protein
MFTLLVNTSLPNYAAEYLSSLEIWTGKAHVWNLAWQINEFDLLIANTCITTDATSHKCAGARNTYFAAVSR